jgi:hypothetical protein
MSRLFISLSQTDAAEPGGAQARAVGDESIEVVGDAAWERQRLEQGELSAGWVDTNKM